MPAQSNEFYDRLLPAAADGGFRMEGYWVWCGSVIKGEDGKYHMFASRWPKPPGFGPYWLTNSEIVHAVSELPAGPYTFSDVALPLGPGILDGQRRTSAKGNTGHVRSITRAQHTGPTAERRNPIRKRIRQSSKSHQTSASALQPQSTYARERRINRDSTLFPARGIILDRNAARW